MGMFICLGKTTVLERYDAISFETVAINQVIRGQLLYMSDVIYGWNMIMAPVVKNRHGNTVGTDEKGLRQWMNIDHIRVAIWRGVLTIPLDVFRDNRATCQFLQENLNRELEIDEFTADMLGLTFEHYSTDPKVFLNTVIADQNRCSYGRFGQNRDFLL